ncbi:MAG: hypothetical protein RLZZ230_858 [Candidatus Parcubacteria bacterium]|jgi:hypothetical protein
MKILKRCIIALAIALTMLATAQAETNLSKLSKLTPFDGKAAIDAFVSMGFEVIPRSELEEVRGEGWVKVTIKVIDWLGRAEIVGRGLVWVAGNFKPRTCVYSGSYSANSTPSYCY